ncbi:MAG: SDR family NAD(P)-dependent oxidoreductase [Candidatus Lokiarchaeota archaeon]|nr:SDR family NAD(P)-dependent oxidoreductase [Candidatus Lokiarchaeota archaeon]
MNKTILITGASSGIGKATAKYFQEKGWNVVATMRSPDKEKELTELENVLVTRLDVLDKDSIKDAVSKSIERFGKIDVLLNNAGYGAYGILEAASDENITRQFNTNVLGLLFVTREVLPHFRKNKDGMIINISSIGGKITMPLGTLYHGTKFAVEGLSEALHYEMETIGVKVKIIEPGVVATDFTGRSLDMFMNPKMKEYIPILQKMMELRKAGVDYRSEPKQIAEVIYRAATDGTNKMRYPAGDDAVEIIGNRDKWDDETYFKEWKKQFN